MKIVTTAAFFFGLYFGYYFFHSDFTPLVCEQKQCPQTHPVTPTKKIVEYDELFNHFEQCVQAAILLERELAIEKEKSIPNCPNYGDY